MSEKRPAKFGLKREAQAKMQEPTGNDAATSAAEVNPTMQEPTGNDIATSAAEVNPTDINQSSSQTHTGSVSVSEQEALLKEEPNVDKSEEAGHEKMEYDEEQQGKDEQEQADAQKEDKMDDKDEKVEKVIEDDEVPNKGDDDEDYKEGDDDDENERVEDDDEREEDEGEREQAYAEHKLDVQKVQSMDGRRYFLRIKFAAPKTVHDLLKLLRINSHVTQVFAPDTSNQGSFEIAWNNTTSVVETDSAVAKKDDELIPCKRILGTDRIDDGTTLLVERKDSVEEDLNLWKKLKEFLRRPINKTDSLTRIPGIHNKFAIQLKTELKFTKAEDLLNYFKDKYEWNGNTFKTFMLERFKSMVREAYICRCVFALRWIKELHCE